MNWILKNKNFSSKNLLKTDFAKNKITKQNKNAKTFLVVLFLLILNVTFFVNFSKAQAAVCDCDNGALAVGSTITITGGVNTWQDCNYQCKAKNLQRFNFNNTGWDSITSSSSTPLQKCIASGGTSLGTTGCSGCPSDKYSDTNGTCSLKSNQNSTNLASIYPEGTCSALDLECIFKKLLIGVLNVVGWLFGISATLFAWVIDPKNISGDTGVLNKQAVMDVWIMVRDTLNMAFILVLLFAAFCTIFQIDKWNLKKVWLNILINALLVNFSYPIARFFIDVSNVAFYYFVNNLFTSTKVVTGSGIFAMLAASSNIGTLLSPSGYANYDIGYLIAMIVILFIMGMTLLIIAGLFVVRIVALTMLIMFSPIGFVGYIFPSSASFADKWWKSLFSYSFFAPIMIFGMAIALKVTEAIGRENMSSFRSHASANVAANNDVSWIASAAFLVIPIVILWTVIGVAKSMGIAGADTIVDYSKKGGKWLANAPGHYSGVYGGTKKAYESARKDGKILGMQNWATKLAFKSGVADREAKFGGMFTDGKGGWTKAGNKLKDTANKEDIKKKVDDFDKTSNASLHSDINKEIIKTQADRDKMSGKEKTEAAAKFKQAQSRKDFDKKLEEDIKQKSEYKSIETQFNSDNSIAETTHLSAMASHEATKPPKPRDSDGPAALARYASEHSEFLETKRKLEESHKKNLEGLKKEKEQFEKEYMQEQKTAYMEGGRKLIESAENHDKK